KLNAWYDDFIIKKRKRMTQLELAEKMRVTDKAVSKWERDLSFPDINSIPKLAEIFEVSVDDLMQVKTNTKETIGKNK
ncbi:helix-turn-helix domain-containing protein, partial [Streptococcus mutans]|uniref:helix-turn-helix domain-containing protein n=2 Tax=Streptococcus mutans TaxID=1309 RepID=UPI0003814226